jgi:hypothetical protein
MSVVSVCVVLCIFFKKKKFVYHAAAALRFFPRAWSVVVATEAARR